MTLVDPAPRNGFDRKLDNLINLFPIFDVDMPPLGERSPSEVKQRIRIFISYARED